MSDAGLRDISNLPSLIASGEISPVEAVEISLSRIAALNPELKFFVRVEADAARAAAREAEAEIKKSGPRSPLHGVPVAVKDIVDMAGLPTTNGSWLTCNDVAAADAAVVRKLKAAGAIIVGKTETHEFAIGGPDFALPNGPARNPWNTAHYPGGSSSGSGAAVAAGAVWGAVGTDTGGSIRIPAAFCGLAGMKGTYGRVSRRGVSPLAYSLDHIGPMTWTVAGNAQMMEAIAGHDPCDPGSANVPVGAYAAAATGDVAGAKIGLIRFHEETDAFDPSAGAAFEAAAAALKDAGAELVELTLPPMADFIDCNRVILMSEAYAVHEADLQTRPELYGPYMRARILPGALMSAADYVQALRRRRELTAALAAQMVGVDAALVAGSVGPAPRIDAVRANAFYTGPPSVTAPFNLTGAPALSVCAGFHASGLPLSVQIVAKPFDEACAYRVGAAVETALAERGRRPSLALPGLAAA